MQKNNFLGNIGLCARAKQCVSGEENCLNAIRGDRVSFLLMEKNVSSNTEKRFRNACSFRKIPLLVYEREKWDVPNAVGRSKCKLIAILKGSWAKPLYEQALQFDIAILIQGGIYE